MKFLATVKVEYEVRDDDLLEAYGSTDPQDCAAIDEATLQEDPSSVSVLGDYIVKVEPVQ